MKSYDKMCFLISESDNSKELSEFKLDARFNESHEYLPIMQKHERREVRSMEECEIRKESDGGEEGRGRGRERELERKKERKEK